LSSVMFRPAMHTREDYDRARDVVRAVIHEWDPYSLIDGCGCPKDEWDGEIARVVAEIPRIASESDATNAISRVFSAAFQPEGFSPSDCTNVGRKLFGALKESGVLASGT
jgi:Domain of unknown function (DUF1871)